MKPIVRVVLDSLWRHSLFLTAAMNLAVNRHVQLVDTLRRMKLSKLPADREGFLRVQQETAKEIGGIGTTMLLDAPREIQSYHYAPLQVALSLLSNMIDFYQKSAALHPANLRDEALDEYSRRRATFIADLGEARDSLLHERYDNINQQEDFVKTFTGDDSEHNMIDLLIEGADRFNAYFGKLAGKDG